MTFLQVQLDVNGSVKCLCMKEIEPQIRLFFIFAAVELPDG